MNKEKIARRINLPIIVGLTLICLGAYSIGSDLLMSIVDTQPPDFYTGMACFVVPTWNDANRRIYMIYNESYILPPSISGDITVALKDYSGIDSVKVKITSGDYDSGWKTMSLAYSKPEYHKYLYYVSWTTPADSGKIYNFTFTAEDTVGNNASVTYRAMIGAPLPKVDGYVTVNGKQPDADGNVYVQSLDLTIRIYVSDKSKVQKITATINGKGLALYSYPGYYEATSTLPKEGRYELAVYINDYRFASFAIVVGEEPLITGRVIAGLVEVLLGIVCIIVGVKQK